jgi:hypothetical protein
MINKQRPDAPQKLLMAVRFALNSFAFAIFALGIQVFVQTVLGRPIEPDLFKAFAVGIAWEAGNQVYKRRKGSLFERSDPRSKDRVDYT